MILNLPKLLLRLLDGGVDYFTEDETNYLNLPIEGKWVIDFIAEYDEMAGEYE